MTTTPSRRSLFALAGLALGGAALSRAALANGETPSSAEAAETAKPAPTLSSADMLGKRLRVITPGQMVTMDYSEDRINIEVDTASKITRVYVG